MEANQSQIQALLELQDVDTEIIRNKKKLEELPQRQGILVLRQKIAEVVKKKTQVQDMIDAAEDELDSLMKEDERLAKKQAETQEALDRVQGDYRSVESYSKDLHGVVKRRDKLSEDMERVDAQIARTSEVMNQIMAGYNELSTREKNLVEQFQSEGGAIQRTLDQLNAKHKQLQEMLSPEIYKAYNRACNECGGIGVARLNDSSCSICRATFDSGKLNKIRQEEPISRCPSCRRLLVVQD